MIMIKNWKVKNSAPKFIFYIFFAASQLGFNYPNQSANISNSTVENEGNDFSIRTDNRDIFRLSCVIVGGAGKF